MALVDKVLKTSFFLALFFLSIITMVIVFCLKNTPASSQFEFVDREPGSRSFVWFLASVDNFCIAFLIGREGTSVFHFNL
jgi:hypothetical protein